MRTIYRDGNYLKVSPELLEPYTPGKFRSKGVFETMLGIDGLVMDAALHLKRFKQGLKYLKMETAINPTVLNEVLRQNNFNFARVRLMAWRTGRIVHVMAMALPYKIPGPTKYRVCLMATDRMASARLAHVKSLDCALFAEAYAKATARGFEEALLLNRQGQIFEASRANIFWIKDKVLYTPPLSSGCLAGITRQKVIRQAKALKIPVKEKILTPEILKSADSAFLTNSLIGLKPIELKIPSVK